MVAPPGDALLPAGLVRETRTESSPSSGCQWRHVLADAPAIAAAARCYREAGAVLELLTCVDLLAAEGTFRLVYHYRLPGGVRHRVVADVPEATIPPSIEPLFASANWYEREVFDMFGVRFSGHPTMEKLLTAEDEPGHPLRKDFKATVTGLPGGGSDA